MKFFPRLFDSFEKSQLIYALFIILLVPIIIIINTVFILYNMTQDTDFELNNKALLVESIIANQIKNNINNSSLVESDLKEIVGKLEEIKAIEILKVDSANNISSLATTSDITNKIRDDILNNLSRSSNQAYSKQIKVSLNSVPQRLWLVVSPIKDTKGKQIGLINLYISAQQIDEMTSRTVNDAIIILIISVVVTSLLLINHFRFYEMSLSFLKLKEVDKIKDDFISIASHELRAPIVGIKGYVDLLKINSIIKSDQQLDGITTNLKETTKRMQSLVEDLLNISRIEQNRMIFEMNTYDIREILNNLATSLQPEAERKGLKLSYESFDKPLNVYCDKNKINEIFSNLISNAIKYTPSGEVVISHQVKDKTVKTMIRDTGVGISDEDMTKLFTKFSRIYNEKTKNVSGSGLGLWITKQLINKMKGKITVESLENKGTQFTVGFPLAQE
jgi:signal transduction histidine kinase